MDYSFNPKIATSHGVDAAIFIHNIAFWVIKNKANKKNFINGYYWTYNSYDAFSEIFKFWSIPQLKRIIKKLKENGIIRVENHNQKKYDKTNWYTIIDNKILNIYEIELEQTAQQPIVRNRTMDSAKSDDGWYETVRPIPVSKPDKTTTKEEEAKMKNKLIESVNEDIENIETEYDKFMNYNHNKFRNMEDLKDKWKKWIEQLIKYSSKKLTDTPKKQKLITYELVSEKIDKDLIMAIIGDKNKAQQQYISEKLEDFINYCVKNQKNYDNYEDSFEKYLEIGRQNGWNF